MWLNSEVRNCPYCGTSENEILYEGSYNNIKSFKCSRCLSYIKIESIIKISGKPNLYLDDELNQTTLKDYNELVFKDNYLSPDLELDVYFKGETK